MHYYQHHIGDFIKDTANLDDHQLATYLRMVWAYYTNEKPITGELEDIAFAMRSDEKTVRLLLRHFFDETPEGWVHNRCEREISEYKSKGEKARDSANARWSNAKGKRTQCERNANASVLDANQEPITNNQEEAKASLAATPPPATGESKPEKQKAAKRATALPEDFAPNDTGRAYAEAKGINTGVELLSFRNWHGAKGTTMKDWQAAWRTWCDKSAVFGRTSKPPISGRRPLATDNFSSTNYGTGGDL